MQGVGLIGVRWVIKIPVPFLFGPRRDWRSFSDPKRVPVKQIAPNTYPNPVPEKRNLWYFRLEKTPYLKNRRRRGTKSNPSVSSENGSGKSAPRSHRKNERQRPDQSSVGTDIRQRQDNKDTRPLRNTGFVKQNRNWWVSPNGSECDSDLIAGKNSPKPKKARNVPVNGRIPSPEFPQDRNLGPKQDFYGNNPPTNGYFNKRNYPYQNRPNHNHQRHQGGSPGNSQNYGPSRPYYQQRQTYDNYNPNPSGRNGNRQNHYPQNRRFYPQEGRPQGPPLDRNQMSRGNGNRPPPPRPPYTRRDWVRPNNSYPQNAGFRPQENRTYAYSPKGNPGLRGEGSLPRSSTLSHTQPENSVGGADSMKVNILEAKNEASKTEKPPCGIRNEGFQTIHPTALLTSIDGIQTDIVEEPEKKEIEIPKCFNCKCQNQTVDLKQKRLKLLKLEHKKPRLKKKKNSRKKNSRLKKQKKHYKKRRRSIFSPMPWITWGLQS
jgi:hypothetical protein